MRDKKEVRVQKLKSQNLKSKQVEKLTKTKWIFADLKSSCSDAQNKPDGKSLQKATKNT